MTLGRNVDHTLKHTETLNETPAAIMNRWKQDLLGASELEVSCMRKETERETNELDEVPTENEYLTTEDMKYAVEI
jgi:hypothetical protein